jgi:hypothetical protein
MTDEQVNIAIAEACGWKFEQTEEGGKIIYPNGFVCEFTPFSWALEKFYKIIPNFCGDLNAMHEAEKTLDYEQLCNMQESIKFHHAVIPFHATAYQRAEAFLWTIGKWEEEK